MDNPSIQNKFFVEWEGDIVKDPCDHGVVAFDDVENAMSFVKTATNKGLYCKIYEGNLMREGS